MLEITWDVSDLRWCLATMSEQTLYRHFGADTILQQFVLKVVFWLLDVVSRASSAARIVLYWRFKRVHQYVFAVNYKDCRILRKELFKTCSQSKRKHFLLKVKGTRAKGRYGYLCEYEDARGATLSVFVLMYTLAYLHIEIYYICGVRGCVGVDLDWYMNIGVRIQYFIDIFALHAYFCVTFTLSNGIESGP